MDYKYIECLIDRYFECRTTVQEERILREFFMQDSVPAHLVQYRAVFETLAAESEVELPAGFDSRLMERIRLLEQKDAGSSFGLRIGRLNRALKPFYKAVASVAIIVTVGVASSQYWNAKDSNPVEYNYAKYRDTYSDPQVAYEQVSSALMDLSDAMRSNGVMSSDTIAPASLGKME